MKAILREKSWLGRVLDVETENRLFVIEYDGRGMGYESVYVNGRQLARVSSWFWFVPRFQFHLGALPAAIELRVWPWLVISSFRLFVNGELILCDESSLIGEPARSDDESNILPQMSPTQENGICTPGRFKS